MEKAHETVTAATDRMWRNILYPNIGFFVFWFVVFGLVYLAIQIQWHLVDLRADFLPREALSNVDAALELAENQNPTKAADYFREHMSGLGTELFGQDHMSKWYLTIVGEIENAIRMGALTKESSESGRSFVLELRQIYLDDRARNIEILRKSGFF